MHRKLSTVIASALAAACSGTVVSNDAAVGDAALGGDASVGDASVNDAADASKDTKTPLDVGPDDGSVSDATADAPPDAKPDGGKIGEGCMKSVISSNECAKTYGLTGCTTPPPELPTKAECAVLCEDSSAFYCSYDKLSLSLNCTFCAIGRRPEGFVPYLDHSSVGLWFRSVAMLEAASVDAFAILHDDLAAHGAPKELLALSKRARRDEMRHARLMSALAREAGCDVPPLAIAPAEGRDLEAIAIENAVEGCVRETYGALVAAWQATHVASPRLARIMDGIARDELSHAELAWRVHEWSLALLTPDARVRVERAMVNAVNELHTSAAADVSETMQRELGLPSSSCALTLVAELQSQLWRQALSSAA